MLEQKQTRQGAHADTVLLVRALISGSCIWVWGLVHIVCHEKSRFVKINTDGIDKL
jgi:hypothetical protein